MMRARRPGRVRVGAPGLVLVVVLVLLAVIGLTAAAAMRGAITQEKLVNNLRLESAAQAQAEFALRWCEGEIQKPLGQRLPEFEGVDNLPAQAMADLRWDQPGAWVAPSGSNPSTAFLELDATLLPPGGAPRPQCLVERLRVGSTGDSALVVTARGFSPGYQPGLSTVGQAGSTVWLQSFLYFD